MPTTVLLDKDGNEFGRIMGEFDFNDKSFINLLKEKGIILSPSAEFGVNSKKTDLFNLKRILVS